MRYALMIYCKPETWGHPIFLRTKEAQAMSEAERETLTQQMYALFSELNESGELVAGESLPDPAITRTVTVRNGSTIVTDGPYEESKNQLAGWFILDCASQERAEEIAARLPDAPVGAIEVRPLMADSGKEM